jgi:hypothetical protein
LKGKYKDVLHYGGGEQKDWMELEDFDCGVVVSVVMELRDGEIKEMK